MSIETVVEGSCPRLFGVSWGSPKRKFITALFVLLLAHSVSAAPDLPSMQPTWTHAVPMSPSSVELLATAVERSAIVRRLLSELERSDVVVYLTDLTPGPFDEPRSHLSFVALSSNARYFVVRIDRFRLTPSERIVLLSHELHHALEVAASPEVRNADTLAKLYRRIGRETGRNRFESDAAKAVANQVKAEISRRED